LVQVQGVLGDGVKPELFVNQKLFVNLKGEIKWTQF